MLLVEVLGADVQRREFRKRGGTSETTILNILDFVVGYQMLRYAANGQRKCLYRAIEYVGLIRSNTTL